ERGEVPRAERGGRPLAERPVRHGRLRRAEDGAKRSRAGEDRSRGRAGERDAGPYKDSTIDEEGVRPGGDDSPERGAALRGGAGRGGVAPSGDAAPPRNRGL